MFFADKKVVGIDIGSSSIKLAEMDVGRGGATLKRFAFYPLPPEAIRSGEITDVGSVVGCITALLKQSKCKRKQVATGMWGPSVIVKKISMPRMEPKLVAEQIRWEAEQYIPFDINEITLDHAILKGGGAGESMDVLIVAAKQEHVFRVLESVEGTGLKVSVVDISGFALANCFEMNYGALPGTVAVLDIGAGSTNVVIVADGQVVFSRDLDVGGVFHTNEIAKVMGVSPLEAEALKVSACMGQAVPAEITGILSNINETVAEEIRNAFEFFKATAGESVSQLYVSGGSIFIPGLVELVGRVTGFPVDVFDPFRKIKYDRKAFSSEYMAQIKSICAVSMGLGLRQVGG